MKAITKGFSLLLLLLVIALPVWAQEEQSQEEQKEETQGEQAQEEQKEESQEVEDDEDTDLFIDATAAVWLSEISGNSSKAEEYGQLPDGFLINSFAVGLMKKNGRFLNMNGTNVGLNDAQYGFGYGLSGKYALTVDYQKIPHLFSRSGETIWAETSPGVWSLPDNIQLAIQNINPFPPGDPAYNAAMNLQRLFVSGLLDASFPQSLEILRDRGNVGFEQSLSKSWKFNLNYFQENRNGYRPFGTTFGFSWVTELPEHVVYKTYDVHAGASFNSNGKSLTFGYDINIFRNEINSMIWDNPFRLDPRTYSSAYTNGDGTNLGRVQLAPDNTANTFSVAAATKMGRGSLTGTFNYSLWTDTVDLLPFTINAAIEPIPLPASQFDGKQQIYNATVRWVAPVGSSGEFLANYRLYSNINDNDQFNIGEYVRVDQVEEELFRYDCTETTCTAIVNPPTPLFGFTNNTIDLKYSQKFGRSLKWFLGYAWTHWNRDDRDTVTSNVNRFMTGFDANTSWVSMRVSYQYAQRRSDEFEIDNPVYLPLPLRRYDVANLNQSILKVLADFLPGEAATLGVSAGVSNNGFPDSEYGVLNWNQWSAGVDFSYSFKNNGTLNAWYEYSDNNRTQRGRQSNSDGTPATSPTRDWFVDLTNSYNTIGGGYNQTFKDAKVNWSATVTYALADGKSFFAAGPALRPTGPVNIDNIDDTDWLNFQTGLDFKVFSKARLGFFYWYQDYKIDDFDENSLQQDLIFIPTAGVPPPGAVGGTITLNEIQPDYHFNSGWIGLIFSL